MSTTRQAEQTIPFVKGMLLGSLAAAQVPEQLKTLGWKIETNPESGEPVFQAPSGDRYSVSVEHIGKQGY